MKPGLLTSPEALAARRNTYDPSFAELTGRHVDKLEYLGIDGQTGFVESRYAWIRSSHADSSLAGRDTIAIDRPDRQDRDARFWGFLIFLLVMAADVPEHLQLGRSSRWNGSAADLTARPFLTVAMPPGDLRELS